MKLGPHELLDRLGVGGMGEVFRSAEGLAVKRLLPHLKADRRFLDLFLAEVRVAAQLQHPNIVRIVDFGEAEGSWYLAMERVDGVSLRAIKQLSPGLVAFVGAHVAQGLDYAHKARDRQGRNLKVVHRDVSPHNVLVSLAGEVKLIDFGVAKATEGLAGKPEYMAPEVASGEPASPASDQYSLGVVLWELGTGKRLFKGTSDAVTLQRAAEGDVPKPGLLAGLDRILLRALAKRPEDRYPDCAALRVALDDLRMELSIVEGAAELGEAVRQLKR